MGSSSESFPPPGDREARVSAMLDGLRRAGLRVTAQRSALVRLFADDASHPTAQELFERVRKELPGVSFATVYNTLDALADAGLAEVLRTSARSEKAQAARFDPNTQPHHHAVCDACGRVLDVPTRSLAPPLGGTHAKALELAAPGFTVRAVERVYRGLCAACVDHDSPHSQNEGTPRFSGQ
jgi:Fur family peroxide stress response transcriptional regulator